MNRHNWREGLLVLGAWFLLILLSAISESL
jgi:hypothetical protein